MKDIVMPKLSDTMTEGRLISWKKRVGDTVKRGDVIAEVETDKANMELEAYASGVLLEIRVESGEVAPVGTVIGTIGSAEEKAAAPEGAPQGGAGKAAEAAEPPREPKSAEKAAQVAASEAPASEAAAPEGKAPEGKAQGKGAAEKSLPQEADPSVASGAPGEELATAVSGGPAGEVPKESQRGTRPAAAGGPEGVPPGTPRAEAQEPLERAAPVVRRRARELGIDLSSVAGSGPEGRILLQDLEKMAGAGRVGAEGGAAAAPRREAPAPLKSETKPLSRQRGAIARTVSESWRTIPHFSVDIEVLMDEADALRHQLKDAESSVSINDMVVKGAALALQRFPQLNASFAGDSLRFSADINICLAVSIPDGLVMPVLAGCQQRSLTEISLAARELVERARAGQISEQDMSGGTFSVSNMGMYGVSRFTAVIYPTQAAILAVGAMTDAVVAKGGVPTVAKVMTLSLSADHRVVDGAYAADFLKELKEILEHPVRLLL